MYVLKGRSRPPLKPVSIFASTCFFLVFGGFATVIFMVGVCVLLTS